MDSGNAALIERFYAAFDRSDGDAMAACYAPDARFSDPVFGELTGAEAGSMWRMLTRGSRDLHVELAAHDADAERGSAHWIATYTFSQTGRPVVNDVRASFRFGDGVFTEHVDRFGFWAWSRQALGTNGLLLGWTPFLRTKVGRGAREGLDKYIAREARRAV